MQDLLQDLESLARKILARFAYFLQDGFYWVLLEHEFQSAIQSVNYTIAFRQMVYCHVQVRNT